ncbi:hypothetical protein PG996_007721 [Apiospora saccharicola]|uniref:Uncharacterized protein n=1 Tax=Apiospora saccharicola TaxID=335842 RepID=A0ABR1VBM3_9PEZI
MALPLLNTTQYVSFSLTCFHCHHRRGQYQSTATSCHHAFPVHIPSPASHKSGGEPAVARHEQGQHDVPATQPFEVRRQPIGTGPIDNHRGGNPHAKTPSSCNYAWPTILAPIASVQSCQDYLEAPDMQATGDCSVPPPPINENPKGAPPPPPPAFGSRVLCRQSDNTVVMGATFDLYGTSSACRDVATGVQWILDQCAVEGQVAGQTPAYGNGDLIVVVQQGVYLNLTAPEGQEEG